MATGTGGTGGGSDFSNLRAMWEAKTSGATESDTGGVKKTSEPQRTSASTVITASIPVDSDSSSHVTEVSSGEMYGQTASSTLPSGSDSSLSGRVADQVDGKTATIAHDVSVAVDPGNGIPQGTPDPSRLGQARTPKPLPKPPQKSQGGQQGTGSTTVKIDPNTGKPIIPPKPQNFKLKMDPNTGKPVIPTKPNHLKAAGDAATKTTSGEGSSTVTKKLPPTPERAGKEPPSVPDRRGKPRTLTRQARVTSGLDQIARPTGEGAEKKDVRADLSTATADVQGQDASNLRATSADKKPRATDADKKQLSDLTSLADELVKGGSDLKLKTDRSNQLIVGNTKRGITIRKGKSKNTKEAVNQFLNEVKTLQEKGLDTTELLMKMSQNPTFYKTIKADPNLRTQYNLAVTQPFLSISSNDLKTEKTKLSGLEANKSALEADKSDLEATVSASNDDLLAAQKLRDDGQNNQNEIDDIKQKIDGLNQKIDGLNQNINDINAQITTVRGLVESREAFHEFLESKNETMYFPQMFRDNPKSYDDTVSNHFSGAAGAFDQTVVIAKSLILAFEKKASDLVSKLPIKSDQKDTLSHEIKDIKKEAEDDITVFGERKQALYLSGFYTAFKNARASKENIGLKPSEIQIGETSLPTASNMMGAVGGSTKKLSDSLIPSFIDGVHRNVYLKQPILKGLTLKPPLGGSIDEEAKAANLALLKINLSDAGVDAEKIDDLAENLNNLVFELAGNFLSKGTSANAWFDNMSALFDLINENNLS